jgi:predicted transcriptional regulator
VFVHRVLVDARERLVVVDVCASFLDAATSLQSGTDLVVVCGPEGAVVGVITKTDVLRQIASRQESCFASQASAVMTRQVVLCRPADALQHVWEIMKEGNLKNLPITNEDGQPIGVLSARNVLHELLDEAEDEEALLRDYVMGVGYR